MLSAGCMRWPRRGVVEVRGGMERAVRTPDGRTLAVEDAGDPGGRPVLVHGGTPCSRHLYGPNVADAARRDAGVFDIQGE